MMGNPSAAPGTGCLTYLLEGVPYPKYQGAAVAPTDHEDYAAAIRASLARNVAPSEVLEFEPNPGRKTNAADAMTDVLRRRLSNYSKPPPLSNEGEKL